MTAGNTEIQLGASPEKLQKKQLCWLNQRDLARFASWEKVKKAPEGYRKIPAPPDKRRT
jgi:hypothetical protein